MLDKQDLIRERNHDLSILSDEEYQKIFIFFSNCKYSIREILGLLFHFCTFGWDHDDLMNWKVEFVEVNLTVILEG